MLSKELSEIKKLIDMRKQLMQLHDHNAKTIGRYSKHYVSAVNEHRANIVQALISGASNKLPNKETIPKEETKETTDPQIKKKKKKRGRPKKAPKPKEEQIQKNNSDTQKFKELFIAPEKTTFMPI